MSVVVVLVHAQRSSSEDLVTELKKGQPVPSAFLLLARPFCLPSSTLFPPTMLIVPLFLPTMLIVPSFRVVGLQRCKS